MEILNLFNKPSNKRPRIQRRVASSNTVKRYAVDILRDMKQAKETIRLIQIHG